MFEVKVLQKKDGFNDELICKFLSIQAASNFIALIYEHCEDIVAVTISKIEEKEVIEDAE